MSEIATQTFIDRLTALLKASRNSGLTNAEAIGCLELTKLDIYQTILLNDEDDDVLPEQ
jgi:hypothetical protein